MSNKIVELVMCTGWANGDHFTEVDTGMSEESWNALGEDAQYEHLEEDMQNFIAEYIEVYFRDLEED